MFKTPAKVVETLISNKFDRLNPSISIFLTLRCNNSPQKKLGTRTLSSKSHRISKHNQSFGFRKHVTSSGHSAGASFATPVTVRNVLDSDSLKIKSKSLPSNMVLQYCPTTITDNRKSNYRTERFKDQHEIELVDEYSSRPLVIILAWMLAKEKHIHKYREFWFERGFDVLSLRTSPSSLLLPAIGGRKNATNIVDFLANHRPLYDEVLIHAFSVGGYQLCEVLHELEEKISNRDKIAEQIYRSFKGMIIDSCAFPQDASLGLSRAVTEIKILQAILQKSIESFFKITKPFTMDRYKTVEEILFKNTTRIPGLVFYSKDDIVSNVYHNRRMHQGWKENGTISDFKCWDKSIHVLHYKEHTSEYQQKVDEFISRLKITKNNKP